MDFIGYKIGIISTESAMAFFDFLDFTGLPISQEISSPSPTDITIAINGE